MQIVRVGLSEVGSLGTGMGSGSRPVRSNQLNLGRQGLLFPAATNIAMIYLLNMEILHSYPVLD